MIVLTAYQAYTWFILAGPMIPLNMDEPEWTDPKYFHQN